jgi:hypothetical protein
LAMAQSDPTSGSGARGPRCGMCRPPPPSGDPAALKVETSAVRSLGSIVLGLPFPILAAMARGAGPCSGRDCLALGPTARRPQAPPTKVSAQQERWSAKNRCRDSRADQPYGAGQCCASSKPHPTRSCYYRASIKRLKRGGVHGLAMAQSDPTSGSEARGPRCGMRSPPPSSGDPAALKVEASAVRSVGSIALGLPFPILAAMARGADPCSGRDCLALGPTARRPHAPPTKVSAQQARWSAENRCRDSGPDQPYGARQYALGRTTHPR